jgi:hypothetical protein
MYGYLEDKEEKESTEIVGVKINVIIKSKRELKKKKSITAFLRIKNIV